MRPPYDVVLSALRAHIGQMVQEGHDLQDLSAEVEAAEAKRSFGALVALQQELWHNPAPANPFALRPWPASANRTPHSCAGPSQPFRKPRILIGPRA